MISINCMDPVNNSFNIFSFFHFFFSLKQLRMKLTEAGDVVLVSDASPARPSGAFPAALGAGPPLLQRTASAMQVSWMEAAQSLRRMILMRFWWRFFVFWAGLDLDGFGVTVDCRSISGFWMAFR
jgi:hypothetical protein